jgi:hypothetical protein
MNINEYVSLNITFWVHFRMEGWGDLLIREKLGPT